MSDNNRHPTEREEKIHNFGHELANRILNVCTSFAEEKGSDVDLKVTMHAVETAASIYRRIAVREGIPKDVTKDIQRLASTCAKGEVDNATKFIDTIKQATGAAVEPTVSKADEKRADEAAAAIIKKIQSEREQ